MNFHRTHQYLLDIQNALNAFVIDLAQLKHLRDLQNVIYFDGQIDFIAINRTIDNYIHSQNRNELGLLENELSRLIDLYALRNKQLWFVDREFVYEEIGEVIHHCLSVQFSQLHTELSDVLRAKLQIINVEKQQNIFGRFFQFDFRDIADAALLSEFSGFEIEIIELENAAEKTKINKAIRRLYQSSIYQVGDGVMVQTPFENLYIYEQNERNHYLKIHNTASVECKTCIGPPKASRCSTTVLATQQ